MPERPRAQANGQPLPNGQALTFRTIFKLAWRTLPYLKEARRDLLRLLGIGLLLLPVGIAAVAMTYDLMLNRLFLGKPLTPFETKLLSLDPAVFLNVDSLSIVAREELRDILMLWLLGAAAVTVPIAVVLIMYWIRLQQRINHFVRVQMVQQVQAMSLRFHSGQQIGDAIYRTYQDSAMVTNLMAMLVRPIYPAGVMLYVFLLLLLFDLRLALSMLAMYAVTFPVGIYFGRKLRKSFRDARETNSALTSRIQETFAAIKVVKAFGTESFEQQRFEQSSEDAFAAAFRARMELATMGIATFVIASLPALAAALYLAVWSSHEKPISAGATMAFLGFAVWNLGSYTYASGQTRSGARWTHGLFKLWGQMQNMAVGMQRAFAHVDLEPEVADADDAVPVPGLEREIAFHGVTFGYEREHPVLHNIDLTAKVGQITALVGPTGSGKSTLVTLLLRLFDPDQGRIEIDGVDLRRFTIDSLRSSVSIALQENLLFGTTIRENIRYAREGASDEEVREAARIACAADFIDALPQGYDTPLGERGSKLSTGQRQRLSIARAIIKDTPVLILDEPTASLDAETEMRVLKNLAEWGKGRAIFLITHRLSTIRRADNIVYLRDGSVIEVGSHAELMSQVGGAYRRFVELERAVEPAPAMQRAGGTA